MNEHLRRGRPVSSRSRSNAFCSNIIFSFYTLVRSLIKQGFIAAMRACSKYKIGDLVGGKTITQVFTVSDEDNLFELWVSFEDGSCSSVTMLEKGLEKPIEKR